MTNNSSQGEPQGLGDLGPPPPYLRDMPKRQASAEIRALAVSCIQIATFFWGETSSSNGKECRWGTHGSRCVNLEKNAWYDHEVKAGGYTIELVQQELGCSRAEAISWLLDDKNYSATPKSSNLNGKQTRGPRGRVIATYDYTEACCHIKCVASNQRDFYSVVRGRMAVGIGRSRARAKSLIVFPNSSKISPTG